MKELDLLSRLEQFPGEDLDSGVDCTLKLGPALDETMSDSSTDDAPKPPNMNFNSPCSQVMQNYEVAKGWGSNSSNHFTGSPDSANRNNNRDEFNFFGGSSSMAAATNSSVLNGFGGYQGITRPRPQNNANSVSRRRSEPEPSDFTRICFACNTTITPLWRNGPMGIKTLCNACGIRYRKDEKRALGITEPYSKTRSASVKGRDSAMKF